jgi:predicted acetyltransferase
MYSVEGVKEIPICADGENTSRRRKISTCNGKREEV